MAKILLAINGSPRKKGNTATLLEQACAGARSVGASAELVQLSTLTFKGCCSCFFCKRKDKPHGICAMQDDLSPVLERIKTVDAIVFGTPIYFMNTTSLFEAFIERLFFSNYIYSNEIPTVFPKTLPSAYIYTMNMTEEHVRTFQMKERMAMMEKFTEQHFKLPPLSLWAYDTYQFPDYTKYESSIFSEEAKRAWRETNWQSQCDEAFAMGKTLLSEPSHQ